MRLLVYPHDLAIGGSQINAVDLAAGIAAAGHEVLIYGIAGPLISYIEERGLRFLPARRLRYRPAPSRIAQLAWIARKEGVDLIHTYEWPPCLDAYYGGGLLMGVPVLCTVLGMTVMPYVPASLPLIMGTAELGEESRLSRPGQVWVLEPPIDVSRDHPGFDGSRFRHDCGVQDGELLIVSVSRLAIDLKLDALVRLIDAVKLLAVCHRVRLVLVGSGAAEDALLERAREVNRACRREVVTLHGSVMDPRSAYAAADVVVAMGSSALRAMAIGRPVVVQGEEAFSEVCEPATLDVFLQQGFYGRGDGASDVNRLVEQIEGLLGDEQRRGELGRFGRQVVTQRFSLDRAVGLQLEIYEMVLRRPPRLSLKEALTCAGRALALELENHSPKQKRQSRERDQELLAAAARGAWPPAIR